MCYHTAAKCVKQTLFASRSLCTVYMLKKTDQNTCKHLEINMGSVSSNHTMAAPKLQKDQDHLLFTSEKNSKQ